MPAHWSRLASGLVSQRGIVLAIVVITLIAFSPVLWGGFVWDDDLNLLNNPHYRGLGWRQLRWMLTTDLTGHWLPLTWISLGFDYLVWGMNPVGYHLTNLLLHAANAGVFYFVARRLLAKAMPGLVGIPLRAGAGIAALFFALHPLRAESVAWLTERRDVLSGLFFLLTVLTYLRASEAEGAGRRGWMAASVGLYCLAISSKSMVMTLPVLLVLLDIYPLRRLSTRWREWKTPAARGVWVEKAAYVPPALVGGVIALYAARTYEFLTPLSQYSFSSRIAMAVYSFWFYLWKTLWPAGLSPLYELPAQVDLLDPPFLLSTLAAISITGGLILMRDRWPAGLAVWIAYVVMLAPVSGLLRFGPQLVADRYSYLSCLGWALLVGAGVGGLFLAPAHKVIAPRFAHLALGTAAVWMVGLGAITWEHVQVWRTTDTVWRRALDIDPTCVLCHNNLGVSLGDRGYLGEALQHFERALALHPDYVKARQNMGLYLLKAGQPVEASVHLERSLAQDPENAEVRSLLGQALIQQGRPGEAVPHLQLVIRQNRTNTHASAVALLGMALVELGRPAEAVPYFQRAIALQQSAPLPRLGLARAYLALGDAVAAREQSDILRRLDPRLAQQLSSPTPPGIPAPQQ